MSSPEPGLCGRCRHATRLESAKGSSYLRCGLADEREGFRRYPALPVLECRGFETAADAADVADPDFDIG